MTNKPANSNLSDEIDANLRRVYEDAMKEDLPDRFLDLLNKLKAGDDSTTDPSTKSGET